MILGRVHVDQSIAVTEVSVDLLLVSSYNLRRAT